MKKSKYYDFIEEKYKEVTGKDTAGMKEKEMAKAIVEIFGNRNVITEKDENKCILAFCRYTPFGTNQERDKFIQSMFGFMRRAKKPAY